MGGTEGLTEILEELHGLGLVDFVNNRRAVRVQDDNVAIRVLATFLAICDLENLKSVLEPLSTRGILFGNKAAGKGQSDSDYDLFVVSETPEEVKKSAGHHPMARLVDLTVWTPEMYSEIQGSNPGLNQKLSSGIVLWGSTW